jgi:hypothetical protein
MRQNYATLADQSLNSNLRYVGDIQTIGVGQIDVVPRHLPTGQSKPPRDGITTIRLRKIVCDIGFTRKSFGGFWMICPILGRLHSFWKSEGYTCGRRSTIPAYFSGSKEACEKVQTL